MTKSSNSLHDRVQALVRLVNVCLQHQGGSTIPIIHFLMGLYDGEHYRPDMQLLCARVEEEHFDDILQVMQLFRSTRMEPHLYFKNGDQIFKKLASMVRPVKRIK